MTRLNTRVTRKERRRDRRRPLHIDARLDEHEVLLTDLSAAGFGVALDATNRSPFDFRVGRRMRLELTPERGETLTFAVEIIREPGENGVLGGAFVALTDEAYNVIESLLTGRYQRRR